jgi:hypothetical protein
MTKELMWVCAILPQELNKILVDTCRKQLFEMEHRLNGIIEPMELTLNRFVVGSSRHGDEYFEV